MKEEYIQKSLVLIKPDGVKRGLSMKILSRFESAGLIIIGLKMTKINDEFAKLHYRYEDIAIRHGESVWKALLKYITEGPIIAVALQGINAVEVIRKLCGETEPRVAAPGTIRGDFAHSGFDYSKSVGLATRNLIHASSSLDDAKRELLLWFTEKEFYPINDFDQFG